MSKVKGKWTTYSLYKYYIAGKHPVSDPRFLAYRTKSKFDRSLEREGADITRVKVTTGKGERIPATKYLDKEQKKIDKETKRYKDQVLEITEHDVTLPHIVRVDSTLNRHLDWSKKVQDIQWFYIGIEITEENRKEVIQGLSMYVDQYLIPEIKRFIAARKSLYHREEYVIGAVVSFEFSYAVRTMDDEGHAVSVKEMHYTVPYILLTDPQWASLLEKKLIEAISSGCNKVLQYDALTVTLKHISTSVITNQQASPRSLIRAVPYAQA